MKELEYPFDARYLIKKKKSLKRELLAADTKYIDKKIAVLGGSTTHDIVAMMELFLLNYGIRPSFYESEYNQYWEDVMFDNPELREFAPDIIYIHTTNRNIKDYPKIGMTEEDVNTLLDSEYKRFCAMWEKIENTYHCPVIQNNFDFPSYRILGNADCYNISGVAGFINSLSA
jgi:predicted enzyme involved in methoxymalonyl-ACP biosynthesis